MKVLEKPSSETLVITPGRGSSITTQEIISTVTNLDSDTKSLLYIGNVPNTAPSNGTISVTINTSNAVVGHYKIQVYNCAFYKGQYKNPPYSVSRDVDITNQFLRNDTPSLMDAALRNYTNFISFNSILLNQAPVAPMFQSIIGPGNTTTATKIYLGRVTPNHANSINYSSKFNATGTLNLMCDHGAGKNAVLTKYTIELLISFATTPTISFTATKISGSNITISCGYDLVDNSYGKIVKPYITITNVDTTFTSVGYLIYECMLCGYGIVMHFPSVVNKDTTV